MKYRTHRLCASICLLLNAGCSASSSSTGNVAGSFEATDITGVVLSNQSTDCADYVDVYTSTASDVSNSASFSGKLTITADAEQCVFTTNAIPNHDFNDANRSFPNRVSAQQNVYTIPANPQLASTATPLSLTYDNAILLNGVKIDILGAGCFGIGNGKIGCNDPDQPWRYDPANPLAGFLVDSHNAHSQPDGTYHYHGEPKALFLSDGTTASPVVGFAADGFAILGSYITDNGDVRAVKPSYQLKAGARPTGDGQPGGNHDGTYRDDYEYVAGSGDLDECNGMMVDGSYRYYITDTYPYALACFKGVPDESFSKRNQR